MLETAPLDVTEATVGYELDAITLRNIASVRYVRHHEWLDHVLGSPLPTSAIVPPKITSSLSLDDLKSQIAKAEKEIAELEAEKEAGWSFHLDEEKAKVLSSAIHKLRTDFGSEVSAEAKAETERVLGVRMIGASPMRAVNITYDRQAVDTEQARIALEKQKQQETEAQQEQGSSNEVNTDQGDSPASQPSFNANDPDQGIKDDVENAMAVDE